MRKRKPGKCCNQPPLPGKRRQVSISMSIDLHSDIGKVARARGVSFSRHACETLLRSLPRGEAQGNLVLEIVLPKEVAR